MSNLAAAEHEARAHEVSAVGAPEIAQHKKARLSGEEYGSYLYAGAFVIVALGCFLITGW